MHNFVEQRTSFPSCLRQRYQSVDKSSQNYLMNVAIKGITNTAMKILQNH